MGVTFGAIFASRTLLVPFHSRGMCYPMRGRHTARRSASGAPSGIGAASEPSPSTGRSFHTMAISSSISVIRRSVTTKTSPQPPRASTDGRCADIAARIPKRLSYSFTDAHPAHPRPESQRSASRRRAADAVHSCRQYFLIRRSQARILLLHERHELIEVL